MTYSPPPHSGPGGNASWSPSPLSSPRPPTPVSPGSQPPIHKKWTRGPIITSAALAATLVAAAALWLVTLSRNNDLLANNEQLIEQVSTAHAEREALRSERDALAARNDDLRADVSDADRTLASCADALDAAENTVELLTQVLDISGDAIEAAATWNAARLESLTRDVERLNSSIESSATGYRTAAASCRAGS